MTTVTLPPASFSEIWFVMDYHEIIKLIAEDENLFTHQCKLVPKENLCLPGPDYIDRVFLNSSRNIQTLRNMEVLYRHGRLAGSGYLSILPVDQGLTQVPIPFRMCI